MSGCGCSEGPKTGFRPLSLQMADGACAPDQVKGPSDEKFIVGKVIVSGVAVPKVSSEVDFSDVLGRWKSRWGIGRMSYKVAPGLYAFGNPDENSPVLVTCNYKLTFDLLRKTWKGLDLLVLALDTKGINVWCAAGKGTFGTEELVRRVEATSLSAIAARREMILPQLGAPGVAAHEVKKRTGFKVVYGPVKAEDTGEFLKAGNRATEKMRAVTFSMLDRFILTPMELVGAKKHLVFAFFIALILSGFGPGIWNTAEAASRGLILFGAALLGLFSGGVITPVFLPFIPIRMFSLKGWLVGVALSAALFTLFGKSLNIPEIIGAVAVAGAISSYSAMNFTGSSTFTSPSGVLREMRRSLPLQVGSVVIAAALWVVGAFMKS